MSSAGYVWVDVSTTMPCATNRAGLQASSASGRAMWKRQVANQQSRERSGSGGDAAMARISLPSGEQIHDM